jgi:hypothetical protein
MRAHFTPQAEIDLEEVGDYIALDNPMRVCSRRTSPKKMGQMPGHLCIPPPQCH